MFSPSQQHFPDEDDEDENNQANFIGFCSFCVELVGGSSKKQNWKGLGIALIVIAIVCLMITAAIFLTNTQPLLSHQELIPLSEHDVFNTKAPLPWNGTWVSDDSFSYLDTENSVWLFHCATLKSELVFPRDILQQEYIAAGILSPQANFFLIPIRKETVHSYYTEYQYDLYEKSKKIGSIALANGQKLSVSTIVYSNSDTLFAFIHNFNIHVYNITQQLISRVTTDGNRTAIHNGLVEWIYEYDIFQRNVLLFWSPTDRYLAFVKINLTGLPNDHYLVYDYTQHDSEHYSVPYPNYHDPLPVLDVYVYSIKSGRTLRIPRPRSSKPSNATVYIYHVVWYSNSSLAVVYGSREGDTGLIQLYEIINDQVWLKSYFIEETRKGPLVSRFLRPHFSSDGATAYIIRFNPLNAEKPNGKAFPQIVRIHWNQSYPQIDGYSPEHIHADEIIRVDHNEQVYFTGFAETTPLEKHFYRWAYADGQSKVECLSCQSACGHSHAQFSPVHGSYYVLECWGPSIPYSTLHNGTQKLGVINDNLPFQMWIENRSMPYIDYFTVPLEGKGTVGHGMLILPPNYNPNVTIASYPVLVMINDRLHDQRVNKKYVFLLPEFVQVIEDHIGIAIFDAHGSTGQDESYLQGWFTHQYKDYLRLARHLKWNEKKFNETLNDTRFGLIARGPAAILALKLLAENPKERDEYQCVFLQSPVTDLSHYHAVFTERVDGWTENDKSFRRWNLRNKSLAFVHGTADEVVHFKHSAMLAKSLIETAVTFDFKIYPDVDHDFSRNPVLLKNLLQYQRRFFRECLGGRTNKERKFTAPDDYD